MSQTIPVHIRIITSCTGDKRFSPADGLTQDDFVHLGTSAFTKKEAEFGDQRCTAEAMYTGLQHVRLMRGVETWRQAKAGDLSFFVLSAGYGLIPGSQVIAPYECTFATMKPKALAAWADHLGVPAAIRATLAKPADLTVILLGDDYQEACRLDASVTLGGPTILFCGKAAAKRLPRLPQLRTVLVGNADGKRFNCGLVGIKGEITQRLLARLAADPGLLPRITDPAVDLLALLEGNDADAAKHVGRGRVQPNASVDRVIDIPKTWWNKPHRSKISYFIPEWDDQVDPDFDFADDEHSGGSGDWSNQVYAHQMYPEPNYDGILISKVVAEKSKKKAARINQMGVHRFLRIPRQMPVMGDCGAFGYIMEDKPPYTTEEILDYYTRLDFDLGVSVDHLIVAATEHQKKFRYDLTIANAESFLKEHRKRKLTWTPMGAVQGWDPASYAKAAKQVVDMGYDYLAIGGLVRTPTPEIVRMLDKVREVVPRSVRIHLFGLARLGGLKLFEKYGVTSVDSASYLRRAWTGTDHNYLSDRGEFVSAIRIPEAGKSFRAKRMVSEGRASTAKVERLESACLQAMIDFDAGRISVAKTLDTLEEYDRLITPDRPSTRHLLEKTLQDAPWKRCQCAICKKDGVQVIIFRGNNRNRRRGFHNIYMFYHYFQRILAGEKVVVPGRKDLDEMFESTLGHQQTLFESEGGDA